MMKKPILAALLLAPLLAMAETSAQTSSTPPMPPPSSVPSMPGPPPPPPPEQESAASAEPAVPVTSGAPAQGQWVYTNQYGWVWMPYGQSFTYLPTTGAVPQMYVYYPAVGWTWVVAPWVWGLGPQPSFGVWGTTHFVWWGRGFGHWYGFRGDYARWGARGYYAGGRWYGHRDVYVVPHRNGAWVGHGGGHGEGHGEGHHR